MPSACPPRVPPASRRPGARSMPLGGSPVNALAYPDGPVDQLMQRILVHIIEALDIQAALSCLVRAQPRQHRLVPALELADQVDGQVLAAGGEAGQRRVTLAAAGIPVVVR